MTVGRQGHHIAGVALGGPVKSVDGKTLLWMRNTMKDRLEREHGFEHTIFKWKCDWRWPGNDKPKIAAMTWNRIAGRGHPVVVRAADGWGSWSIPFMPSWVPQNDLCVVRINLIRRESQYLGWMSQSEYGALDVVNWGHPRNAVRRRVVLDWMLTRGLPPCVLSSGGLMDDDAVCGGGS